MLKCKPRGVCVGGGGIQGTHTGNSQKAPTWGSWRFSQSLLAFAKSILILCYLKGKQLVLPRLFPPTTTCVSNWVGPLSIHQSWRASKVPRSRRSERGSGDKADHCSLQLILGALPSPGPLAHRSPSLPMLYGFRKTVICTSGSNNSWPHPP